MLETNFVKLCNISDIPENEMKVFNIQNIEFVVVNNNKEFHAVYNKYSHMGVSLGDGSLDDSLTRFGNYISILKMGIDEITRVTRKNNVHSLDYDDLITTNIDILTGTGIEHT